MPRDSCTRNPFPVPDVSREGQWLIGPVLGKKVLPDDKDWGDRLNAHERLFAHHTLNSVRKDRRLVRPKVPRDALDLAMTTVYVHSKDTLVPKPYVTMQPESLGLETWRVLRNEVKSKVLEPEPEPSMELREEITIGKSHCYRGPSPVRRLHPSSVKLNIDGPHTVQSNPGYSRKVDGTFFSI